MKVGVAVSAVLLAVTACSPNEPANRAGTPLPGPTRVEAGVPVGYPLTAEGAQAAAVRYVALLGGPLALDPVRRDTALAAVSAAGQPPPAVAARWATRPNVERATGAHEALSAGEPLVAAAAPVMSQVTAYDGDTATVAVWVAAVLGTTRLGRLDQSWATETVTLRWDADDWKLASYESTPGPVPALHQPVTPLAEAFASTRGMQGIFDVSS
jgi:hypothetical protein